MNRQIIVLGAGGHARVVLDILKLIDSTVLGVTDPHYRELGSNYCGCKLLGDDDSVWQYSPETVMLVNAIGELTVREALYQRFKKAGYMFASVIHPRAVVAAETAIAEGVQIMAGAVVQPGCTVGANSIVNTRSSLDHECIIGMHAHIASGATLCGKVNVGTGTHVGAGATIIQNIKVGERCFIAAGAVVVDDITGGAAVKGVPAKVYRDA